MTTPAARSLRLLALASEQDGLRLWATLPGSNPVNSPRVMDTETYVGEIHEFNLTQAYAWPALGPGVCPNGSNGTGTRYADADVQVTLAASPAAAAYSLLGDNLYWLQDLLLGSPPPDVATQLAFLNARQAPVGPDQQLAYTLTYRNLGTETAQGVTAQVTAQYALRLLAGNGAILSLGDIPAGAAGTLNFQAVVDTSQSNEPWAGVALEMHDTAHPASGEPFEWLWISHRGDRTAPQFFGLTQPQIVVAPGQTLAGGYAYDESGVAQVSLAVAGGATTDCALANPQGGLWRCPWNVAGSNGDILQVTLRARDTFGQESSWSRPLPFLVDAAPPTVTVDLAATQVTPDSPVTSSAFTVYGDVADPSGVGKVEVCAATNGEPDGPCGPAKLQLALAAATITLDDAPTSALPIGASCVQRTFSVAEDFAVAEVSLGFTAEHARRDELQVDLTSPAGTTVRVLAGAGGAYASYDALLADRHPAGLESSPGNHNPAAPFFDQALGSALTTETLGPNQSTQVSINWPADGPATYVISVIPAPGAAASPLVLCNEPQGTQRTITVVDRRLSAAWNLISFPVAPLPGDVATVLRPIDGAYRVIQSYSQGWQSYYPQTPPEPNTLESVDALHGYWIKANDGISPTLRIAGARLAEDASIELAAGWNLVSYLPQVSLPVTQALAGIEGHYLAVHGFDQGAQAFYPDLDPSFNTLSTLDPLRGYWIQTTGAVTLRYTGASGPTTSLLLSRLARTTSLPVGSAGGAPPPDRRLSQPRQAEEDAEVSPTNQWINLYGALVLVNGEPAPVGAVVRVFDPQGVQCGAFVVGVANRYGVMPCYRDDATTLDRDEGAEPGDILSFTVDGEVAAARPRSLNGVSVPSSTSVSWTQNLDRWEIDLAVEQPVAATLASFSAQIEPEGVRLVWETVSEIDHLGFNVHRGPTPEGPWTQLNDALIPSPYPGSTAGAVYEWFDANIPGDPVIWYQLESLDIHGSAQVVAQTSVQPNQGLLSPRMWLPLIVID